MIALKDIAIASGVSVRTVCRVLRENGYVGEGTRRKVLATAQRLGYRPHRAARSLRTGKGYIVTVIMNQIDELHTAKLAALQQQLAQDDFSVNVIFAAPRARQLETLLDDQPFNI